MRQATGELSIATRGRGLVDITRLVADWLETQEITTGLLTVFVRHTSASLTIQENADPDVLADLEAHLDRAVPRDARLYRHVMEGPDDMPAHIRCALTATSLSVPVLRARMALGTWQALYLWEHRDTAHRRAVVLHVVGE